MAGSPCGLAEDVMLMAPAIASIPASIQNPNDQTPTDQTSVMIYSSDR
jgi:hypothetical protein